MYTIISNDMRLMFFSGLECCLKRNNVLLQTGGDMKLSKFDTLQMALTYIAALNEFLPADT